MTIRAPRGAVASSPFHALQAYELLQRSQGEAGSSPAREAGDRGSVI